MNEQHAEVLAEMEERYDTLLLKMLVEGGSLLTDSDGHLIRDDDGKVLRGHDMNFLLIVGKRLKDCGLLGKPKVRDRGLGGLVQKTREMGLLQGRGNRDLRFVPPADRTG